MVPIILQQWGGWGRETQTVTPFLSHPKPHRESLLVILALKWSILLRNDVKKRLPNLTPFVEHTIYMLSHAKEVET